VYSGYSWYSSLLIRTAALGIGILVSIVTFSDFFCNMYIVITILLGDRYNEVRAETDDLKWISRWHRITTINVYMYLIVANVNWSTNGQCCRHFIITITTQIKLAQLWRLAFGNPFLHPYMLCGIHFIRSLGYDFMQVVVYGLTAFGGILVCGQLR